MVRFQFNLFRSNDIVAVFSFLFLVMSPFLSLQSSLVLFLCGIFFSLSVSSAVHSAEVIAQKVGPSLGTLILALAVTIIEVALIVALMSQGKEGASSIARDTVFAAIMIVTNGIIGACMLLGGLKHKELGFQAVGTSALLSVLSVLSVLTMVLPNFTISASGPFYTSSQLIFVSLASLALYGALVFAQTKSHKIYFAPTSQGEKLQNEVDRSEEGLARSIINSVVLVLSLISVVGLAKLLSPFLEGLIVAVNAPRSVVGIIVAFLVLAPEALAAMKAAKINQLQTSLNLALGSGAASIALTIPSVSVYSLITKQELTLGLDSKSLAFLAITFLAGGLTVGVGRSTALHGLVHLIILISYVALSFMP